MRRFMQAYLQNNVLPFDILTLSLQVMKGVNKNYFDFVLYFSIM